MSKWEFAPCFEGLEIANIFSERKACVDKLLLIMGVGFDPRMNVMASILHNILGDKIDILLLRYSRTPEHKGVNSDTVERNLAELSNILGNTDEIKTISLQTLDENRNFAGDFRALNLAHELSATLIQYTDIVVDLGALPTYISFPFIKGALLTLESCPEINFYISTGVDQDLDDKIIDVPDHCRYLAGFQSNLELDGMENLPKIWVPVLGPGRISAIKKIYDHVVPLDICPVLPFPSKDPRRPDFILEEYQSLLSDPYRVSPNDISYASELGPLDVYRRLLRLHSHYQKVLHLLCEGLGSSRTVVSPLCSKMLSIGVLLAAIDKQNDGMGLANAFGGGHSKLDVALYNNKSLNEKAMRQLMVWVTGAPFL